MTKKRTFSDDRLERKIQIAILLMDYAEHYHVKRYDYDPDEEEYKILTQKRDLCMRHAGLLEQGYWLPTRDTATLMLGKQSIYLELFPDVEAFINQS